MELYVKGLIESLKNNLLKNLIENKRGIHHEISSEIAPILFEGSLMTLIKFGMITSEELEAEKYKFSDFINTPYDVNAIHFFFSIKRNNAMLLYFDYKGYDVVNESGQSIILYKNTGTLLDEVYQNGLLTYLLFDMPNEESKTFAYSSLEKMGEQELKFFREEEQVVLTATLDDANTIKCLPVGNYILQILLN